MKGRLGFLGQLRRIPNAQNLEKEKRKFLIQDTTQGGRACDMICCYTLTDEKYEEAIEALRSRF